ncbi:MAG: hypothetical protein II155_01835 [Clostridia bacterium]|nr:hypothetical protein [Clostridia bacterium]
MECKLWYHSRMDSLKFSAAVSRALLRKPDGIGMLGEKSLHSALKYYYEPDETKHEIAFEGFFADIMNEDGITEIQTGSLFALNRKLEAFLDKRPVTVVHPIVGERRLIYMDTETGELKKPRLSPKRGRVEDAFRGLIHIRRFLSHPGLMIVVPIVDADEYRYKTGERKRRRAPNVVKYELVPRELKEEWVFAAKDDWLRFVPPGLLEKPDGFTVMECASALSRPEDETRLMLGCALAAGALRRERDGRAFAYFKEET